MTSRKHKFALPAISQIQRLAVLSALVLFLLGLIMQKDGRLPFRMQTLNLIENSLGIEPPSPSPTPVDLSSSDIRDSLNGLRNENKLPPLEDNTTLQKAARLLSLDLEDRQTLEVPEDNTSYLKAVSSHLPSEIETFAVFFPAYSKDLQFVPEASSSAATKRNFREIGIAMRNTSIQGTQGTLAVVITSPAFINPLSATTSAQVASSKATYTGIDLWAAVQNYRRSHQLPEFAQDNALCTVASIRLNEQIQLGHLDNHDGFDKRSQDFFKQNQGWSTINENLASGYETAVQVVEWGWDQSLGHKALIQSRDYPKACAAAGQGFAVLITGR